LVQKEKEVTQLRETIERMEKKYKDKAELVTVSLATNHFLGTRYRSPTVASVTNAGNSSTNAM
jgi:5,10-methylenetetrahydrofolate reductase